MKWCKTVALSLSCLVSLLFGSWLYKAQAADAAAYKTLTASLGLAQKVDVALTQTKEDVDRTYWFLRAKEPFCLHVTYPMSQIFRDDGLVEEIANLRVVAVSGPSTNILTAERGRLDYGKSLLLATEAHLERYKEEKKFCDALAESVILELKESSPTFTATSIKAELCS